MKYICDLCGWIYDSDVGDPKQKIPAGTLPEDISKYFGCPICGADWASFTKAEPRNNKPVVGKQDHSVWSSMKYEAKTESER